MSYNPDHNLTLLQVYGKTWLNSFPRSSQILFLASEESRERQKLARWQRNFRFIASEDKNIKSLY